MGQQSDSSLLLQMGSKGVPFSARGLASARSISGTASVSGHAGSLSVRAKSRARTLRVTDASASVTARESRNPHTSPRNSNQDLQHSMRDPSAGRSGPGPETDRRASDLGPELDSQTIAGGGSEVWPGFDQALGRASGSELSVRGSQTLGASALRHLMLPHENLMLPHETTVSAGGGGTGGKEGADGSGEDTQDVGDPVLGTMQGVPCSTQGVVGTTEGVVCDAEGVVETMGPPEGVAGNAEGILQCQTGGAFSTGPGLDKKELASKRETKSKKESTVKDQAAALIQVRWFLFDYSNLV
jgi:hypothetical protein